MSLLSSIDRTHGIKSPRRGYAVDWKGRLRFSLAVLEVSGRRRRDGEAFRETQREDRLFHDARVLGSQSKHKRIIDFNVDELDGVMLVNVRGVTLGMKHSARCIIWPGISRMHGLKERHCRAHEEHSLRAWQRRASVVPRAEDVEKREEFVRGLANSKGDHFKKLR
ncbi:hypothetical protein CRG98_045504 [Punica granatum]|uniref:Uncharacterized protein n=1 Tax=Punica granatum TaxID=22663 RepID=A0A2I0HR10_PUNGR|nr:hypothetical protein CRG98_045504 [Punica granatum]